jgi:polyphosphate glucokinase
VSARRARGARTLAIDVGGTVLKAAVLDADGRPIAPTARVPTPHPATPSATLQVLGELAAAGPPFTRVAVGFPGVVVEGVVQTAVNLHPTWVGVNLTRRMERLTGRPTRVANDADVQGLGVVAGRGVELVVTLGTGVGSALFLDGRLVPNLELGHHPFQRGRTYEQMLGDGALKRIGNAAWRRRLRAAVEILQKTFRPRRLYLGGGNARLVHGGLPPGVTVVSNVAGVLGGIRLWAPERPQPRRRRRPRP